VKPLVTTGSDYVELTSRQRVPAKGLALRGALVYEDGREIGVATGTPANAAVQHVMCARGDYVEIRYLPAREALKKAAA
jgi:hypothetical protein